MAASVKRIAAAERLVLVAQTYFPAIDGTAVLIQHLAEQFAACGDEVHVITTDALGPAGFRTPEAERTMAAPIEDIRGVRVHRLPTYWWLSSMSRPGQAVGRRLRLPGAERIGDLYLGPLMRGFLGTLDKLAPTAVYASSFPYWHMHQLVTWGQSHRVPVVLHGAIHPEDRWAFDRSSIRRSCSRAAGYAANTGYEARYVEGLGVPRDRITVVGVGVDLEALKVALAERPEASGASRQKPRILYLGHLTARKGLDTVIAALPTIWARHPSVEVVIAGKTTEDAHDLRRAAFQVSQGHDLRWLPDVTETEKAALFASASMVLYPSRAEFLWVCLSRGMVIRCASCGMSGWRYPRRSRRHGHRATHVSRRFYGVGKLCLTLDRRPSRSQTVRRRGSASRAQRAHLGRRGTAGAPGTRRGPHPDGRSAGDFWARGYFVSTVGRDEAVIREYIQKQE